jgi:hypothetical protein
MSRLWIIVVLLTIIFVSAYFLFPYLKNNLNQQIFEEEKVTEETPEEKGDGLSKTPEKKFKPVVVISDKGFEISYTGFEEGIVNSFPSYVSTETSDFLVYDLEYNDRSIILTWEMKRGTLNWINLKVFRYEKLVFNQTSNESRGKIEYVHNDPSHHHSPSVKYSFEKVEPGTLLFFNIKNNGENNLTIIFEKVVFEGEKTYELASENFLFGRILSIEPSKSINLIFSYPDKIPPEGELTFYIKIPKRAGKIDYEELKMTIG